MPLRERGSVDAVVYFVQMCAERSWPTCVWALVRRCSSVRFIREAHLLRTGFVIWETWMAWRCFSFGLHEEQRFAEFDGMQAEVDVDAQAPHTFEAHQLVEGFAGWEAWVRRQCGMSALWPLVFICSNGRQ